MDGGAASCRAAGRGAVGCGPNVHSAKDWWAILELIVDRDRNRDIHRIFQADAAFASPDVYEFLEVEGSEYAIRLPSNDVLQRRDCATADPARGSLLERSGGVVPRLPPSGGQLDVTNLRRCAVRVVQFYN